MLWGGVQLEHIWKGSFEAAVEQGRRGKVRGNNEVRKRGCIYRRCWVTKWGGNDEAGQITSGCSAEG